MLLIPQIYLKNGQVAALGGRRPALFKDDPIATASAIKDAGAETIHIIDLGLPPVGTSPHLPIIKKIYDEMDFAVYIGGGFRSAHAVESYINAGVEIIALGTIAYQQPALLEDVCKRFPGRIATHIDVRGGRVTIPGYTVVANKTALDYAERFIENNIRFIFYSDVDADGKLTESNLKNLHDFCSKVKARIICTSEIRGPSDIERIATLRAPRLDGLILSKSLYEGRIDLRGAIAMLSDLSLRTSDESTLTEM